MENNLPSKSVIHKWAVASATAAGILPAGPDALVLFSEEVMMVGSRCRSLWS